MDGGHDLPPVIADRRTRKLADGAHRWHAATAKGVPEIAVEWRDYATDADLFRDALVLNSSHGLNFTTQDRLRVIQRSQELGLADDLPALLRVSASYIETLLPRFATVRGEPGPDGQQRRVPLKAAVRHLAGQQVTPQQAVAINGNAPGAPYLLLTRQLIAAVEQDFCPRATGTPCYGRSWPPSPRCSAR